jgi:hypothetical protein
MVASTAAPLGNSITKADDGELHTAKPETQPTVIDKGNKGNEDAILSSEATVSAAVPSVRNDPRWTKYHRMVKAQIPQEAVVHRMVIDRVVLTDEDAIAILNNYPPQSNDGLIPDHSKPTSIAYKDHPVYSKYFRMIKVGVPEDGVKAKMQYEGVDPAILEKGPG